MREPTPHHDSFGLLAEFDRPQRLVEAIQRTRQAGYRRIDAYSPFPIEAVTAALAIRDNRVPLFTLLGGLLGAATGYFMQVIANRAFPIDIGGRPLVAPPAFMLITFELMVLFAVTFSIGSMLLINRLPRLNHPLFDIESFHLASRDKFFLLVFSDDPRFDRDATRGFLEALAPVRVDLVGHSEEPE